MKLVMKTRYPLPPCPSRKKSIDFDLDFDSDSNAKSNPDQMDREREVEVEVEASQDQAQMSPSPEVSAYQQQPYTHHHHHPHQHYQTQDIVLNLPHEGRSHLDIYEDINDDDDDITAMPSLASFSRASSSMLLGGSSSGGMDMGMGTSSSSSVSASVTTTSAPTTGMVATSGNHVGAAPYYSYYHRGGTTSFGTGTGTGTTPVSAPRTYKNSTVSCTSPTWRRDNTSIASLISDNGDDHYDDDDDDETYSHSLISEGEEEIEEEEVDTDNEDNKTKRVFDGHTTHSEDRWKMDGCVSPRGFAPQSLLLPPPAPPRTLTSITSPFQDPPPSIPYRSSIISCVTTNTNTDTNMKIVNEEMDNTPSSILPMNTDTDLNPSDSNGMEISSITSTSSQKNGKTRHNSSSIDSDSQCDSHIQSQCSLAFCSGQVMNKRRYRIVLCLAGLLIGTGITIGMVHFINDKTNDGRKGDVPIPKKNIRIPSEEERMTPFTLGQTYGMPQLCTWENYNPRNNTNTNTSTRGSRVPSTVTLDGGSGGSIAIPTINRNPSWNELSYHYPRNRNKEEDIHHQSDNDYQSIIIDQLRVSNDVDGNENNDDDDVKTWGYINMLNSSSSLSPLYRNDSATVMEEREIDFVDNSSTTSSTVPPMDNDKDTSSGQIRMTSNMKAVLEKLQTIVAPFIMPPSWEDEGNQDSNKVDSSSAMNECFPYTRDQQDALWWMAEQHIIQLQEFTLARTTQDIDDNGIIVEEYNNHEEEEKVGSEHFSQSSSSTSSLSFDSSIDLFAPKAWAQTFGVVQLAQSWNILDDVVDLQINQNMRNSLAREDNKIPNTLSLPLNVCEWFGLTCSKAVTHNNSNDEGVRLRSVQWNSQRLDLQGTFPKEIYLLSHVRLLDLSFSQNLIGSLPESLWMHLHALYLEETGLNVVVPSLLSGTTSSVTDLRVSGQQRSGLPSGDAMRGLINLKRLTWQPALVNTAETPMRHTSIPTEIGLLTRLESLSVHGSKLKGIVPSELTELISLRTLDLGSNQFTTLPSGLEKLQRLEWFSIADNTITGSLPMGLLQLPNLKWFELGGSGNDYNRLSLFNLLRGLSLECVCGAWDRQEWTSNHFRFSAGPIPSECTCFDMTWSLGNE